MEDYGLAAQIPISWVSIGLKLQHPVLGVRDFITGLSDEGKLNLLFAEHDETDFASFWERWRCLEPDHPVFRKRGRRLGQVVPMWIHADEGTSQKKRSLMVIQCQPILGFGTSRGGEGLNYTGVSITTRFLYSVTPGRMYSGKKNKNKPLLALVDHFARDLADCFHRPIKVDRDGTERSFFLCTLGMKGDWPALTKIGQLRRHHLRDTWSTNTGVGICHRCLGGQEGHSWHDVSYENMLAMRRDVPVPWTSTPGIISNLPVSSKHVADFFKIDLFHTFHKGVFADAAANAIVSWSYSAGFPQNLAAKTLPYVLTEQFSSRGCAKSIPQKSDCANFLCYVLSKLAIRSISHLTVPTFV